MPIVACASQKGGTGKTTTAAHLCAGLAQEHGQRVLAVDADPQTDLTFALGIDTENLQGSLADAQLEGRGLSAVQTQEGFDLVPGSPRLAAVDQPDLGLLRGLSHPWVVIDTPPALSRLTLGALTVADVVLLTVDVRCGLSVMRALPHALSVLGALEGERRVMVVQTHVDRRLGFTSDLMGLCAEHEVSLSTPIRISSALAKAAIRGETVFRFDPHSRGAEDYRALTQEVLRLA
jgi:chromosome partitioning protein